jgi:phenylalanine-4-hydroxylase
VPSDAKRKRLENLYAQVRKIRESKAGYERLGEIWETQQAEHPEDWLLSMEIFEIFNTADQQPELKAKIEKFLNEKKGKTKDLSTMISCGFRLVEYHKKPEYQAVLHASPKRL